jgi:hypothetical protein
MSKQRFDEIVKEITDLHDRKNHDYAGGDYLLPLRSKAWSTSTASGLQ